MDIVLTEDFFPQIGGAHLWLYETFRRWPSPVRLLTRRYDRSAEEVAAQAAFDRLDHGLLDIMRGDIVVGKIDLLAGSCRRRFWNVASEIKELAGCRPFTVHCLRAFPEGFAGLITKFRNPLRTHLITFAHGEEILVARSSGQLRRMASAVYRWSDVVIANSRSTEELVRDLVPSANLVCVHPGVDVDAYYCDPDEISRFRRQWEWPADTIIVTTIARMEPRKNQSVVIRAIADLRKQGFPLAYVCGGDGEEKQNLVDLAHLLNLEAWVKFPGRISEEEKVVTLNASDIYAMPSIHAGEMIEGFGIVFLEAGAAGIPSIAGNVGGQPEAVLDGKTGLIVDGKDVCQVADAIRSLASNAELRGQMAREVRKWALRHDWGLVSEAVSAAVTRATSRCSAQTA